MFPPPNDSSWIRRGLAASGFTPNNYQATFPVQMPNRPNPLAQGSPASVTPATASGVAEAMNKRGGVKTARSMRLSEVPSGIGPQNMYNALSMLSQAKALVNPAETLKKNDLSSKAFEKIIDQLAQESGDNYDFDSYRKNPKKEAILKGLLGAGLGGLSGSLGGLGYGLAGAAAGGLTGAGYGYTAASHHNKNLLDTAKVLRDYGLLRPDYLRAAMPLLRQNGKAASDCNLQPSAAGDGDKKYKIDDSADAKGADAFKSLDAYMKQAGLNSFQANFFGRLVRAGWDESHIRQAVKFAGDRFGKEVAVELNSGIEKIAFAKLIGKVAPAFRSAGSKALSYFQPATKAFQQARANQLVPGRVAGQALTGFGTGFLNPQTGAMSDDWTWTGALGSGAAGAMGGGLVSKFAPRGVGRALQDIQRKSMAGAGVGYTAGMLTGQDDATSSRWARYGQLAGLLPGTAKIPKSVGERFPTLGKSPLSTSNLVEKVDPMFWVNRGVMAGGSKAMNAARSVGAAAKADPLKALGYGLGGGGLALGGYGLSKVPGAISEQGEAARQELQNYAQGFSQQLDDQAQGLQNQFHNYAQSFYDQAQGLRQDINDRLAPVSAAGTQAQNLLTGANAGFGLGNIGQYFSQNKDWLIPLLLGGGGAALGYGLGGGGGATLGGIGLPLAYLLMQNPQLFQNLSQQAAQPNQQAAQPNQQAAQPNQQAAQPTRDELAVQQQQQLQQQQQQQAYENEIQRQQRQQEVANQLVQQELNAPRRLYAE